MFKKLLIKSNIGLRLKEYQDNSRQYQTIPPPNNIPGQYSPGNTPDRVQVRVIDRVRLKLGLGLGSGLKSGLLRGFCPGYQYCSETD